MIKLKLSEWTSIAEIIGMIAVVISLAFVGYEINQNTSQLEATGASTGLEAMHSVSRLTATDEETEFILKAMENFDTLSAVERAKLESKIQPIIMDFEITKKQYDMGFINDDEYNGFARVVSSILRTPGVNQYFDYAREFTPPYLEKTLNEIIAKHEDERTFLDYLKFGTDRQTPTNLQQITTGNEPLSGLITFAFYKDVEAAEDFYVNVMGLKKSYHRDITRVFQVTPGAAIGLMDHAASPDTIIDNKDMGFSFIVPNTEDVDRWYEYLKSYNVEIYAPPSDGTRTPVRSVHFYDPEGYDIEIFAWLPDAEMIKE